MEDNEIIKNRIEFVYMFDVKNGNPNGDPDAANMPRVDAETGKGLVSDVCLKRKVRNYVQIAAHYKEELREDEYDIFITEGAVLDSLVNKEYDANQENTTAANLSVENHNDPITESTKEKSTEDISTSGNKQTSKEKGKGNAKSKPTKEQKEEVKKRLCKKYFDIRTFGQVIATSGRNDSVHGPIQMVFADSVDTIFPRPLAITRIAASKENENQDKDNRTMGRKPMVPYGLYVCHGFISANLAQQTKFSEKDLKLFWEALKNMFDMDRSAARGLMSAQKLIVFKHNSILGNAPASKLFDLVTIKKKKEVKVPRSFDDYEVTVPTQEVLNKEYPGVTVEELI